MLDVERLHFWVAQFWTICVWDYNYVVFVALYQKFGRGQNMYITLTKCVKCGGQFSATKDCKKINDKPARCTNCTTPGKLKEANDKAECSYAQTRRTTVTETTKTTRK